MPIDQEIKRCNQQHAYDEGYQSLNRILIPSRQILLGFLLWPESHYLTLPFGLPRMPVAFLFSIVGSVIGAMYTAPFLAAVQGLARLRMRASAAALFSLTGSGLGSGLGPLLVGGLADRLEPTYGVQSLRWALVAITASLVLMAFTSVLAARRFREDLAANQAEPVDQAS